MRTIGGQDYEEIGAPEVRLSVYCHKLSDPAGRKYRLVETRGRGSLGDLEELLLRFEKIRHYHLSPLIAWQEIPNGYEWLFPEPKGQKAEEILLRGPQSAQLVDSFIDQALTLYGAFETQQWLPQNFHPQNLWLDGTEFTLMDELEFKTDTRISIQLSAVPDTMPAFYLSPEELTNHENATWASLEFRIGIIAYHLLSGQHPFGSELTGLGKLMVGKPEPFAEELLFRHRPLCQRILKLLRVS